AAHIPGVLGDAVDSAGDQQARNRATIGGTLASAAPGSDVSAALLVLEATADIVGPNGSRVATVAGMLDGSESLAPGELITAVTLAPAEPGSAYCRLANRANLHAICGVAVTLAFGRNGAIIRCRVAVTGALSFPQRLTQTEAAVIGAKPPVPLTIQSGLYYVEDSFASAAYREYMTGRLAERAFASAVARARNA
ncbi:MAG TPA: FAD binding domain-containing protein, partial [Pseudonocardiaceae bacterium]|nr:FAD binding domain-containing protein [Pseudonocardiaceae bacterium]